MDTLETYKLCSTAVQSIKKSGSMVSNNDDPYSLGIGTRFHASVTFRREAYGESKRAICKIGLF